MKQVDIIKEIAEGIFSEKHFCLPAKIETYDFSNQKASVKPLIKRLYKDDTVLSLPIIHNVPVIQYTSGVAGLTIPIKLGASCLLIFAERSLENWLSTGGEVDAGDPRKSDLTDAIAIIGLNSFNINSLATNNEDVILQNDGSTIIIKPNGDIEVQTIKDCKIQCNNAEIIATTKITCQAPTIDLQGNTTISGTINVVGVSSFPGGAQLGGAGGQPIARQGDAVVVSPITGIGTITAGSSVNTST